MQRLLPLLFIAGLAIITFLMVPIFVGIFARGSRRATLWSTLIGTLAAGLVWGSAYMRHLPSSASLPSTLALIGIGATISGVLGWLSQRLTGLFRAHTPLAALRGAIFLFLTLAWKIIVLLAVSDVVYKLIWVDLARDIPEIMYLLWNEQMYLYGYVVVIMAIALIWSFRLSRPSGRMPAAVARLMLFRAVPVMGLILLFAPILMAAMQTGLSIPLLDCRAIEIPNYVPDMIDFTRLVWDSVAKGVMLGLGPGLYPQTAICTPQEGAAASIFIFLLNSAPLLIIIWLGLRVYLLRMQTA